MRRLPNFVIFSFVGFYLIASEMKEIIGILIDLFFIIFLKKEI